MSDFDTSLASGYSTEPKRDKREMKNSMLAILK